MEHPAHRLKDPPWDRLPAPEQASYLHVARGYVRTDLCREGQPDVTPEEFEDAVQQAAREMYTEACELRTVQKEQAREVPRLGISRESGQRVSL